MEKLIGLVDCNNFFASCERVFRPDLDGKPVMVLSANDGCIIARSNEVKAMGIEMGTPLFKVRDIVEKYKINIFSTNFSLYGSLSSRVMNILGEYTPNLEVYSIDEAFMDFTGMDKSKIEAYCRKIAARVKRETGIPTSIGISETKTLAKVACKIVKKVLSKQGAMYMDSKNCNDFLNNFELKSIWGIGWAFTKTLNNLGLYTALDLKNSDIGLMRKRFGVTMQRTIMELNGTSCLPVGYFVQDKKNILRSRSFGEKVSSLRDLESAISSFVRLGGNDLRKHDLLTWQVSVFVRTDKFYKSDLQYRNFVTITLPHASSDQIILNKAALDGLQKIYKPNFLYKKAGILLSLIIPRSQSQLTLGENPSTSDKNIPLNKSIDKLNYKYGSVIIHMATEKPGAKWHSKSKLRSSSFLSSWCDLPIVKAN